jgi:lipopolysaccharide transport system ATP-binding protein
MMIRLAFAVIAHVDASILIVDEALSVGDAFFTQKCMRFIRHFQNEGGTLLFVSHDTASVCSLCGSAIWLDKGRIFQRGTPKEISEQYLEATLGNVQRERAPENTTANRPVAPQEIVDQRQQYINSTNLRNDLKVFDFDPNAPSFGNGGALITNVEFLDETGKKLSWIVGGEEVVLKVDAKIERPLASPIIGFYVRDRLGQTLFGDNTYLSYINNPLASNAGDCLQATFRFQMPRLPVGNYSISVAIADGNQAEHIQHHWIHDSLMFSSQSTSVASGVVGIPMRHIDLEKVQKDEKHG